MDDLRLAVLIIRNNLYAVVSTADNHSNPWNSPVYICNDGELNFYWASYQDSQHSININSNHKAFLIMFDSHQEWGIGQGFYMRGAVSELENEIEIAKVCQLRVAKVARASQTAEDFMGNSPRRIFKFTPQDLWVNNMSTKGGKILDLKTNVDRKDLIQALKGKHL